MDPFGSQLTDGVAAAAMHMLQCGWGSENQFLKDSAQIDVNLSTATLYWLLPLALLAGAVFGRIYTQI